MPTKRARPFGSTETPPQPHMPPRFWSPSTGSKIPTCCARTTSIAAILPFTPIPVAVGASQYEATGT